MNLYNYIVTSENDYILPSIIPLLDELLVKENLLQELVSMWNNSEDEYVAYWMIKKYPYLMSKVETFQFSNYLYVNDLIKVITDMDKKSEIVLSVTVKTEKEFDYIGHYEYSKYFKDVEFEGDSNKVLRKIVGFINLDTICKINKFKVDGKEAIGKIPFCYFETITYKNNKKVDYWKCHTRWMAITQKFILKNLDLEK